MVLSVAVLAFAAVAVLAATLGGVAVGSISSGVAGASLAAGFLGGALAARATSGESFAAPEAQGQGKTAVLAGAAALLAFAFATVRQFVWLGASDGGRVTQLNPYAYGDLPLHWTYVSFLSEGASFWPQDPILVGARLSYPIGSDLLAALFVKLGADPLAVFRVSGLVAAVVLALALRRWGGALAVAAFVFSGGLALSRFAAGALLRPDDPDLAWKNVLLALFVPQRGFLFALPAGLLLLWSAREELLRDRRGLPAPVAGLLWGAMPLFHVHTFLVFSLVYGVWALGRRRLRLAYPSLLIALPLATLSVWLVTDGFAAASLVWWRPGWMIGKDNPLVFLFLNFGLLPPLALAMLWQPPREDVSATRFTLAVALLLFAALFFVMLAPWEWDNTKAFVWCVLLMLGPLPAWLAEKPPAWRFALLGLLLLPGMPAALGGFLASTPLVVYDVAERASVCAALHDLPADTRIATEQTFNHPVALCGRALVAGYPGHLWSHGLRADPVQHRLERLMNGDEDWAADARALGVRYLFWGPRESRAFPHSTKAWARNAQPKAHTDWGDLWALGD